MSKWIYYEGAPSPKDCLEMFDAGGKPTCAEFFNALEVSWHLDRNAFYKLIKHLDNTYVNKWPYRHVLLAGYIAPHSDWGRRFELEDECTPAAFQIYEFIKLQLEDSSKSDGEGNEISN